MIIKPCFTKIVLVASFMLLSALLSNNFVYGQVQSEAQTKITLTVSYANDTAQHYTISLNPQEKYTLSQSYSWVRDQASRYNLQAYSIDNNPYVSIPRVARGNFTLDVPTDSSHFIIFLGIPQYPVEVNGTNSVIFFPPSPTSDNWFDINSDIQILIPYVTKLDQQNIREQLKGVSIDGSNVQIVQRQESGNFSSPVHMSSMHTLNFMYENQYYVNVNSQFGNPTGSGWYDSGTTVHLSVTNPEDFPIHHVFSGWEGPAIEPNSIDSASVLVDSPKTLTARWSSDYTMVAIMVVIPAGVVIGTAAIYRKRKSTIPKTQVKEEEKRNQESIPSITAVQGKIDDSYLKEITNYISQKSFEKLDSFQTSGTLSPKRHIKIKEKLSENELSD